MVSNPCPSWTGPGGLREPHVHRGSLAELPFSALSLNCPGSYSLCLPLQGLLVGLLSFLPLAAFLPIVAASTVTADCQWCGMKRTPVVGSEIRSLRPTSAL